ncbi:uncharacterized protein LOC134195413 [Corticium candelabrum]|uniref:uncharacterized protein LOC134195413 n=1 Tax=Corticium candelabrum TaxID=121492 RepID=UPI002E2609E5|nr:uncharacterized protein LOC134195413 [Corticium candelabrum]
MTTLASLCGNDWSRCQNARADGQCISLIYAVEAGKKGPERSSRSNLKRHARIEEESRMEYVTESVKVELLEHQNAMLRDALVRCDERRDSFVRLEVSVRQNVSVKEMVICTSCWMISQGNFSSNTTDSTTFR